MVEKEGKTQYIAKAISKIFHPYIVLFFVITLIAYQMNSTFPVWLKWTMVTLLPAYLLPLSYMQAKATFITRNTGASVTLRSYFRDQPNEMLLMACLFGIPSVLILYLLGSPPDIIIAMVGIATTSLLNALVNQIYKSSFHLSLLTSLAVILVLIFSLSPLLIAPFLLIVAASRYYLGEHTPLQLLAGFSIGLVVTLAVFYGFSLLPL